MNEKPEYGLKEQIQRACDGVAGDRVVGKSPYTPEQIAKIDAFNKANPPPPAPSDEMCWNDPLSNPEVSEAISVAYERCAQLVESSHTAHDLHEIAATIRGWKQPEESL